ncbi:MAG: hypothetical protein IJV68_01390 [Clostridia bacterium]|nr:hypothetical protein [Clostridia bacterium]
MNNICLDVDQCSKSITLLLPYRDSYDKINGLINASNNYVEGSQRHIIEIKECINQTVKIQSNLEKIRKRFSHIKNAEIAFATIGFITFFAIISFYEMMVFLIRFQSAATVFAFFIIMLNYYFRDVIEENFKKQTSDILSYIESAKKEIDKKIQDSRAFVILDEVEKLVKKIELMENTKNENIKQAKTTQP